VRASNQDSSDVWYRSVWTVSVTATPVAAAPGKPSAPTVAVLSATSLRVSWVAPPTGGSAITGYALRRSSDGGTTWADVSGVSGTGTSFDVTGLMTGTAYVFQVLARNAGGAGAWSDSSVVATPDAVPGQPSAPTVTVLSATSVRVSWAAPSNPGSAITGYVLRQSADGGTSWTDVSGVSGTGTSFDVPGLTPGTAYVFQVLARNAGGDGA
jgi:hypothetical protein